MWGAANTHMTHTSTVTFLYIFMSENQTGSSSDLRNSLITGEKQDMREKSEKKKSGEVIHQSITWSK
jgi:hypothetical protein